MKPLLPVQAIPFLRQARRLIWGRGTIQSVSQAREILVPEEKDCPCKPALFLPGQLEKITDAHNGRLTEEIERVTATRVTHGPTVAYHISNATLLNGTIYASNLKYQIGNEGHGAKNVLELGEAAVASTPLGSRYFGHWLMDDCLTYELARNYDRVVCGPIVLSEHQTKYRQYFEQDWAAIGCAKFDRLLIFEDACQNTSKQQRHAKLRESVRQQFPRGQAKHVYLRRGRSGTLRTVANEIEIIENLVRHGFIIADIESDTIEDLLGTLCNADIIVSLEGSHVSHCCYSVGDNTKLILLQPADRFCAAHTGWLQSIGMQQAFVVGQDTEHGYVFPVLDILKTIDLALTTI